MIVNLPEKKITIKCDICGKVSKQTFNSFDSLKRWKQVLANGWYGKWYDGGWYDVCHKCSTRFPNLKDAIDYKHKRESKKNT